MEITLKNFQKKTPIPRTKILKAAKAALKNRDVSFFFKKNGRRSYFSIVFVGAQRMRSINRKYLKHDYVTDVLTFDLGDNSAEIIICPQVASANARKCQTSTEKEIILYAVHGILHLAGYDDHTEKDKLQMRKMENKIMENK